MGLTVGSNTVVRMTREHQGFNPFVAVLKTGRFVHSSLPQFGDIASV